MNSKACFVFTLVFGVVFLTASARIFKDERSLDSTEVAARPGWACPHGCCSWLYSLCQKCCATAREANLMQMDATEAVGLRCPGGCCKYKEYWGCVQCCGNSREAS
ncbi:CYC02 protein-like [Mercurialis annua]|uniref:CYC02 protein-like n=1 Tax=Mercurialis annua TaxID=3986 RepID=UPI00215E0287|nr:CYC02 protein-like [Mercurialis annua]